MKDEQVRFIGIDPGNNGVKYAYFSGDQVQCGFIPNVSGPAIKLDFPPAGRDEELLSVEVLSAEDTEQSKPTFIGELARTQLQEQADQDRDRNKAESDSVNIITPAVLGLLGDSQKMVLGVGATLQDYSVQAPLLQQKLTKRHEIYYQYGTRAGETVRPEVIRTWTSGRRVVRYASR